MTDSTTPSQRLHATALPLWEAQLEHPFVRGIGDGTLEEERFRRWVLQDYLYLKEFARIFAWAVAKADRLESMGWYATVLDMTLNTEMELHRTYARRFGISEEALEAERMWPTTRAYTDFLVRTAADGDMADLLAALLPCAWGYIVIGKALAEGPRPADDRYADWIEQYASEEFEGAGNWLRNELDRVAGEALSDTRYRRLEEIFLTSSRYELLFWDMCWEGEAWPEPA
jgi:thiaminase (transcriptional activator TenA)